MPEGRFNLFESVSDKFLPVSWGVAIVLAIVFAGFFFAMQRLLFERDHESERRLYLISTLTGSFFFLAWFLYGIKQFQAAPGQGLETSFVDLVFIVILGLLYGTVVGSVAFGCLVAAMMLYEYVIKPFHDEVVTGVIDDVSRVISGEERVDPEVQQAIDDAAEQAYHEGVQEGRELQRDREREEAEAARREKQRKKDEWKEGERKKAEREVHHEREGARMKCDMFYTLHQIDLSNVGCDEKQFWRLFDRYLTDEIEPGRIQGRANDFLKMLEERVQTAIPGKRLNRQPESLEELKEWKRAKDEQINMMSDDDPRKAQLRIDVQREYDDLLQKIMRGK